MKTQIESWGKSLAVRIPKPAVEKARFKEGDILEVHVTAEGRIELRRSGKVPKLVPLANQIAPRNR